MGLKVIVTIKTEHSITRDYLNIMAKEIENIREPNKTYLYNVEPIY